LHVVRAERIPRIQVAVRIVLLVALAIVSWPAMYWILYLTLPAIVALILLQQGLDTFGLGMPLVWSALSGGSPQRRRISAS
jgi:hypothetical protein